VNISRLQHRVLDLLHYWLEGYYSIDFNGRQQLVNKIKEFVKDYVSEHFNKLLQIGSNIRHLVIFLSTSSGICLLGQTFSLTSWKEF